MTRNNEQSDNKDASKESLHYKPSKNIVYVILTLHQPGLNKDVL